MDEPATDDRLLGGRVRLRQPAGGLRAAIDAVLLAAAVPAAAGDRVLELGTGAGAAALCLAVRVSGCLVIGVELAPALAALARDNAAANGLSDRLLIVASRVERLPLRAAAFDRVMMNPPYLPAGRHTRPPDRARGEAAVEGPTGLAGWIEAARGSLRPGGALTLIHRADRLDEICALLRPGFGAIDVVPLWPGRGRPARRVVVRARRGRRTPTRLHPGLVLHDEAGGFTAAAEAVLRHAGPLV